MKKYQGMMRLGVGCVAMGVAINVAAQQGSKVEVYGLLGTYISQSERSGGPQAVTQMGSGGLTTPYIGIRGSEDLGGGYKAIFALESFLRNDTGAQGRRDTDPFFSRSSLVGIEGGFGKLTLGRQGNPTYINMGGLTPFGPSVVFSPLVLQSYVAAYNGAYIGDTVWDNVIQYSSPRIAGFVGNVVVGMGEVAGRSGTANLGLHTNYVNGAFTAAFSAQRFRIPVNAPMTRQDAYLLGATYDFRILKLYGSLGKSNAAGTRNDTRTVDVGVKVPVTTAGSILAEWAQTRRTRDLLPRNTRDTVSLGYDHFLSRRTDVYAVYTYDKQTGFGQAGSYGVGIRHAF